MTARLRVAPGDVVVAGSDGLFDNLHSDEIVACVAEFAMKAQKAASSYSSLRTKTNQNQTRTPPPTTTTTATTATAAATTGGRPTTTTTTTTTMGSMLISPGQLAQELVKRAFEKSTDRGAMTPYATGASMEFDMCYSGGKKDDICAVCAVIL